MANPNKLILDCPAFREGEEMPRRFTCDGDDVHPQLGWMHVPEGTQSFAIVCEDLDAPKGTFTHWLVYDIPGDRRGVAEREATPGTAGRNDFHGEGYRGPCPPPREDWRRYVFRLYALDVPRLGLPPGATREEVERAMAPHVLARTALTGRYRRR